MAGPKPEYSSPALQYGEDATYSAQGDAYDGTALKVTPALAIVRQGDRPARQRAAQYANWVLNQFAKVFNALIAQTLDIESSVLSSPVLNWSAPAAIGLTTFATAWSDVEQAWYVFGQSASTVQRSVDFGKTWAASGTLAVANGPTVSDAAFDTLGNVCLLTQSGTNIQEGPFVSYGTPIVWTNRAGVFPSIGACSIVFDPNSGLWCVIGSQLGSAAWVYTSSNRSTWISRAIPATWSSTGAFTAALGVGGGIILAVYKNTSTSQFRTMRSSDGGMTWTNDQAITVNAGITLTGASGPTRPAWSDNDGLWYVAIQQDSPRKTQVFSSPDGITWTSTAALLSNDCRFLAMRCIGPLLVALNDDGRVFCSYNKGVTWFRCGATVVPGSTSATANNTFKAGGNGLLAVGPTTASGTSRLGMATRQA